MTRTFGPSICHALPGYHAFTGCDFTASFANKGKVRPFNILKKNITYQKTFAELASATDNHYKNIYKFTAEMYGLKNCTNIDEARYSLFCRLTSPKKQRKLLDDIKHLDAAMLPPCKTVLDLKVKRCEYITKIWKHAGQCNPIGNLKPEDYGWVVSEAILFPNGILKVIYRMLWNTPRTKIPMNSKEKKMRKICNKARQMILTLSRNECELES